jgi:hypothetical protein
MFVEVAIRRVVLQEGCFLLENRQKAIEKNAFFVEYKDKPGESLVLRRVLLERVINVLNRAIRREVRRNEKPIVGHRLLHF